MLQSDIHLQEFEKAGVEWFPEVNQIELHPFCQQKPIVEYCKAKGIVVQGALSSRLHLQQSLIVAYVLLLINCNSLLPYRSWPTLRRPHRPSCRLKDGQDPCSGAHPLVTPKGIR